MNKLFCLILAIPEIISFGISYWIMMDMILIKKDVDEHLQKFVVWLLICVASISWCGMCGTIGRQLSLS